jgi:hypothetical protein
MRVEGFSCSLGVLYGGPGISTKLQYLIKKIEIKFPAINFFSILGHQTLNLDPESGSAIRKNVGSGSGSALNQCGSETLLVGCESGSLALKQGGKNSLLGLGLLIRPPAASLLQVLWAANSVLEDVFNHVLNTAQQVGAIL